jgi:predicted XRE-type DNA-binding protein
MRAKLLSGINKWLNKSGLTQTEAAAQLGVTQARVSEIKNGKINRFSLSMLVRLAQRTGLRPGSSYRRRRDERRRERRASPRYKELCTKKRSDFNAEGEFVVRSEGLEPPRFYSLPPQGSASTNSATSACLDRSYSDAGPDQRRGM